MPLRKLLEIGQKFGRLTIKESGLFRLNSKGYKVYISLVECECGTIKEIMEIALRSGKTKSCGCFQKEKAKLNLPQSKHSMTNTSTYHIWTSMKQRCLNPNHKKFKDYGGRGIKVCERWVNSFDNFVTDMGTRPKELSLDRINVNGNYEPGNCRWTDWKIQHSNRRNNIFITLYDKKMIIAEASRLLNLNPTTINNRARRTKCTIQESVDYYASKSL